MLFYCCFVYLSCSWNIFGTLLKSKQIYPRVIIKFILWKLIFVKISTLSKDNFINLFFRPMLFFKVYIKLIQFTGFLFRNISQTKFHDLSCPIILMLFDLKFTKFNKISLIHCLWTQVNYNLFKHFSGCLFVSVFELKFGYLKIRGQNWISLKIFV